MPASIRPLIVTEADECWRIEGSYNRDHAREGTGAFFATIWKFDGRILDLGIWGPKVLPLDEALKYLREHPIVG